jgi:maleamate amidohydrolase
MVTDDDLYARQGFGRRLAIEGGCGLVVIDFVNGFLDPELLGGGNIGPAAEAAVEVLRRARLLRWPIAHSRIVFAGDAAPSVFALKVPALLSLTEDAPASAIIAPLAPEPGELVIRKTVPSAFHGTPALATWLRERAVRNLVIVGCTTSGCVRASTVDAMTFGFRPFVLSDCVGDRAITPHEASLFDIAQKYGEVLGSREFFAKPEALAR